MKCPKCNYISFDYNQSCPKCKKDLTEARGKMNHPSFRPMTLAVSSFQSQRPTESIRMEQKAGLGLEQTTEIRFPDSQDFGKVEESDLDFSLEDESDELSLDFDDLEMDEAAPVASQKKKADVPKGSAQADMNFSFDDESDELSLDFEEPGNEDAPTEVLQTNQKIGIEESLEAKLDLSFEEDGDSDIDLQLAEEDEVTAAFDFGDLSLEEPVKNSFSDLEVLDLDLDLEKAADN